MPDPIHVERTFQELIRELEKTQSIRHRFTLIRHFILLLEKDYSRFESYLIQLGPHFPSYSCPVTYSGIDPEEIASDIRLFEEAASRTADLQSSDTYRASLERLRQVCIIQFGIAGEVEKAKQCLSDWIEIPAGMVGKIGSEHPNPANAFLQILKRFETELSSAGLRSVRQVKQLIRDLEMYLTQRPGSVLIPVVEQYQQTEHLAVRGKTYGRLRSVSVKVLEKNSEMPDKLRRMFQVIGVEKPVWIAESTVSAAAGTLFERLYNTPKTFAYTGEINFELSGAIHEGNSANAAVAALWFTGIHRFENRRKRYEIDSRICITGDVDETGHLIPVDDAGVRAKARAVFFSCVPYLAVPASQASAFRREISILEKAYPARRPGVLPVDHLQELFYDRRLSIHHNPSKAGFAMQTIWEKKFESSSILVILLLIALIAKLAYGPIDRNPVGYSFAGEVLEVKNRSGAVLEEIQVGSRTVNLANRAMRGQFANFSDLTGDGINEIIWAETDELEQETQRTWVKSKPLGDDQLIWEIPLRYELTFPNRPYIIESDFRAMKIHLDDLDNDGRDHLLISMNHGVYFPGILSYRDTQTGDEISRFVNTGHIRDYATADITGDGSKELLLCGINNAYNMAFMAVLSRDQFNGYSPATEEYRTAGHVIPNELSYLLIPMTEVGRNVTMTRNYNVCERIAVMNDEEVIRIYVQDFNQYDGSEVELPVSRATIQVYFNYDLSVRGIGTSDGYNRTAAYLYDQGFIDELPDYRYFDDFKKTILYWNGDTFNPYSEE
jgi:hypothetical protein